MSKIFLSMPVADKPELKTINSLFSAILSSKHQVIIHSTENDSLISRIRNSHVSSFLDEYKQFDYFFSLDSDLEIVNCCLQNNIFDKLIAHDKDFVGGLYALKSQSEVKSSSFTMEGKNKIPKNIGLVRMKWLSTGCWCLKRQAIEKMANAYPELIYDGDGIMAQKKVYGLYIPFIKTLENGSKKYLSEDWAFADRWHSIGGEIYADTSIVLKHIGKYSYELWNEKVNLPPAGFDLT
jgi:hypothetical protein